MRRPPVIRWFGNAAHFIGGHECRFHMATQVGKYLVSTVGELWWSQGSRRITASIHDAEWYAANADKKGDDFDNAYMRRFGYDTVGLNRKYETMVFKAGKPCTAKDCNCGLPEIDGSELDFAGYNERGAATRGHMTMVAKYVRLSNKGRRLRRRAHSEGR